MKKLSFLLPVLLCAFLSAPAAAQTLNLPLSEKTSKKIDADITRAIAKAREQHQARVQKSLQDMSHACCENLCTATQSPRSEVCDKAKECTENATLCTDTCDKAHEGHAAVCCAACGERIADPAQHCAATGYTGLCSPSAEPVRPETTPAVPSVCPVCGHEYTIDEKYHGAEHRCTPKTKQVYRGGNGGEPETDPVFIESGAPVNPGMNGGEPETEYFSVQEEERFQVANGGEPQTPSYVEINPNILHQAEARLQADRDAHDGRAQHSLGYYYHQVLSEQNANK